MFYNRIHNKIFTAVFNDQVDQSHEKERLKMRIVVLEESVKSCELECKASRETVLRLVAELDRERRKAASSAAALDSVKVVLKTQFIQYNHKTLDFPCIIYCSNEIPPKCRQQGLCGQTVLKKQIYRTEWPRLEFSKVFSKIWYCIK